MSSINDYNAYCICMKKTFGDELKILCERCYNDWAYECPICDPHFEVVYKGSDFKSRFGEKKPFSYASVLKGEIKVETEETIENYEEDMIDTVPRCSLGLEFEVPEEDEKKEGIILNEEVEVEPVDENINLEELYSPVSEESQIDNVNETFETYLRSGDLSSYPVISYKNVRVGKVLNEPPLKRKKKNKGKKVKSKEPEDEKSIEDVEIGVKRGRWYMDWLFSSKWDYILCRNKKPRPFTRVNSMDYLNGVVILSILALGLHYWDRDFTYFSSRI